MKLLILFPRRYWETKMSSGRRDVISRLLATTDSVLSGQGWPDWFESHTLRENLARLAPDADAILWYKPLGNWREGVLSIARPQERDIPAVEIFNEAFWPGRRAYNECQAAGTDLVIHHHLADSKQFTGLPAIHIPHCADPDIFAANAKDWGERTTELLVIGTLNRDVYPLRTRVAELIASWRLRGEVRAHPGYRLTDADECRRQQINYARDLGNAKYVVCCSSKYGFGLAKFVEAAQAGACVIGDIPPDFRDTIGRAMVEIQSAWDDDRLVEVIKAAVKHDLWFRASEGQDIAVGRHGITGYCERLLGAIQGYLARNYEAIA